MADKQEEIGKNAEALPQSQASAAGAPEPKAAELKATESNSSQNSTSTSTQKEAGKEVAKEVAKEPEKETVPAADKAKSDPGMSKGEKVFNWVTYKGLNYWVNLILSVAVADRFINPPQGERNGKANKFLDKIMNREKLDKWINSTAKSLNKMNVSPRTAHHNSKVGWESLILLTGGTLLLLPLKFLEDNKRKVVHWLNKKMGIDQTAPDGHEKTPDEIHIEKEQPKQSVGNLLWRRAIGTVSVVTSGIVIDKIFRNKNKTIPGEKYNLGWAKVTYDPRPQGGKEHIEEKVFGLLNKASEASRGKKFDKHGTFSRWTKLAILDSMFTAITATVMWMTSGAKKGKMPNEIDDSNDPPVLKNEMNRITTAADVTERAFADRVENRVQKLVEAKSNGAGLNKGFVETLKSQEASTVGLGV